MSDEPRESIPVEGVDNCALLIVDVQVGLFHKPSPVYKGEEMMDNINALVDQAHRVGVPVLYIQHSNDSSLVKGSGAWRLHPWMQPTEQDLRIHKTKGSAFVGTNLSEELDSREIRSLVVTGLVTHGCVQATCQDGIKHGYRVILVEDGHSNFNKKPQQIIAKWTKIMVKQGVEMLPTSAIQFSTTSS
jgi:nicotinamidase-related amidase